MFEYVNEIAVLGTTFFMMAFGTLWYSEYVFQKPWRDAVGLTPDDLEAMAPHVIRSTLLTFVAYFIPIFLLAVAVGYAQVLEVSVKHIAGGLALSFSALIGGLVVWEQRSLQYFLITAGFVSCLVIISTILLVYWPW